MLTTPRIHQIAAANAAVHELQTSDRTVIVMPCGTGKTLVGVKVCEDLDSKKVVLFFPSLALIKQTLQAWKDENPLGGFDYLCVCSDQTVDEDEAHISLDELGEGDHVTTDPARIRSFLSGRSLPKFIFATYQSAIMIQPEDPFDLAIMDEAHRTAGAANNAFAVALSDSYIPIKKRVFMTATPRHVEADEGDAKSFSMLDESIYGRISYAMSIGEAIESGIICDYKIIVSVTTDADLAEISSLHNADAAEASTIASAAAIRSAMDSHGASKIITFHKTVQSAFDFSADKNVTSIIGAGMIGHVNGKQSSAQRDKVMSEFKGASTGMVTNARCLTEGVDVPSVDMVAFLSRKNSIIDIVQACGRAMRVSEGKTAGHILLPLHVSMKSEETVEQAVLRSGFNEIWRVIHSMREQDMIVSGSKGRMMSFQSLKKANKAIEGRFEVVGASAGSELVEAIRSTVMAVSAKRLQARSWEDSFSMLLEAREKYDTWKFAALDSELAFLDVWIDTQKKAKRNGTLRKPLEERLVGIAFPFNQKQSDGWNEGLQNYIDVKASGDKFPRSKWIDKQRSSFRAGKLSQDRIQSLVSAGFEFDGMKSMSGRKRSERPEVIEAEEVAARKKAAGDKSRAARAARKATGLPWDTNGYAFIPTYIEFIRENLLVCGEKAVMTHGETDDMDEAIRYLVSAKNKGWMSEDQIKSANDAGLFFEYARRITNSFSVGDVVEADVYKRSIISRLLTGPSIIPRIGYAVSPGRYLEYALWMRLVANNGLTEIEARIREEIIDAAGDISNPDMRVLMSNDEEASVFGFSSKNDNYEAAGKAFLDKILSIESALD